MGSPYRLVEVPQDDLAVPESFSSNQTVSLSQASSRSTSGSTFTAVTARLLQQQIANTYSLLNFNYPIEALGLVDTPSGVSTEVESSSDASSQPDISNRVSTQSESTTELIDLDEAINHRPQHRNTGKASEPTGLELAAASYRTSIKDRVWLVPPYLLSTYRSYPTLFMTPEELELSSWFLPKDWQQSADMPPGTRLSDPKSFKAGFDTSIYVRSKSLWPNRTPIICRYRISTNQDTFLNWNTTNPGLGIKYGDAWTLLATELHTRLNSDGPSIEFGKISTLFFSGSAVDDLAIARITTNPAAYEMVDNKESLVSRADGILKCPPITVFLMDIIQNAAMEEATIAQRQYQGMAISRSPNYDSFTKYLEDCELKKANGVNYDIPFKKEMYSKNLPKGNVDAKSGVALDDATATTTSALMTPYPITPAHTIGKKSKKSKSKKLKGHDREGKIDGSDVTATTLLQSRTGAEKVKIEAQPGNPLLKNVQDGDSLNSSEPATLENKVSTSHFISCSEGRGSNSTQTGAALDKVKDTPAKTKSSAKSPSLQDATQNQFEGTIGDHKSKEISPSLEQSRQRKASIKQERENAIELIRSRTTSRSSNNSRPSLRSNLDDSACKDKKNVDFSAKPDTGFKESSALMVKNDTSQSKNNQRVIVNAESTTKSSTHNLPQKVTPNKEIPIRGVAKSHASINVASAGSEFKDSFLFDLDKKVEEENGWEEVPVSRKTKAVTNSLKRTGQISELRRNNGHKSMHGQTQNPRLAASTVVPSPTTRAYNANYPDIKSTEQKSKTSSAFKISQPVLEKRPKEEPKQMMAKESKQKEASKPIEVTGPASRESAVGELTFASHQARAKPTELMHDSTKDSKESAKTIEIRKSENVNKNLLIPNNSSTTTKTERDNKTQKGHQQGRKGSPKRAVAKKAANNKVQDNLLAQSNLSKEPVAVTTQEEADADLGPHKGSSMDNSIARSNETPSNVAKATAASKKDAISPGVMSIQGPRTNTPKLSPDAKNSAGVGSKDSVDTPLQVKVTDLDASSQTLQETEPESHKGKRTTNEEDHKPTQASDHFPVLVHSVKAPKSEESASNDTRGNTRTSSSVTDSNNNEPLGGNATVQDKVYENEPYTPTKSSSRPADNILGSSGGSKSNSGSNAPVERQNSQNSSPAVPSVALQVLSGNDHVPGKSPIVPKVVSSQDYLPSRSAVIARGTSTRYHIGNDHSILRQGQVVRSEPSATHSHPMPPTNNEAGAMGQGFFPNGQYGPHFFQNPRQSSDVVPTTYGQPGNMFTQHQNIPFSGRLLASQYNQPMVASTNHPYYANLNGHYQNYHYAQQGQMMYQPQNFGPAQQIQPRVGGWSNSGASQMYHTAYHPTSFNSQNQPLPSHVATTSDGENKGSSANSGTSKDRSSGSTEKTALDDQQSGGKSSKKKKKGHSQGKQTFKGKVVDKSSENTKLTCLFCNKLVSLEDPNLEVCRECTPCRDAFYCSKACLLVNAVTHSSICGQGPLVRTETAIPERLRNLPAPILTLRGNSAPLYGQNALKYRQRAFAMHCSSGPFPSLMAAWAMAKLHPQALSQIGPRLDESRKSTGSYYIFRSRASALSGPRYNDDADVIFTVIFESSDPRKQAFKRVMNGLFLLAGYSHPLWAIMVMELAEFLFRMIRDVLLGDDFPRLSPGVADNFVIMHEFATQFQMEFFFNASMMSNQSEEFDFDGEWPAAQHSVELLETAHPVLKPWL